VRAGVQANLGGSFAKFLGDTVAADLSAAGHLNPKSTPVILGVVTDPNDDSAVPTAHPRLAAKFTLTHGGKAAFQKTLEV
jgi:hypothetical protein